MSPTLQAAPPLIILYFINIVQIMGLKIKTKQMLRKKKVVKKQLRRSWAFY